MFDFFNILWSNMNDVFESHASLTRRRFGNEWVIESRAIPLVRDAVRI